MAQPSSSPAPRIHERIRRLGDVNDVALLLSLSPRTVRRRADDGSIPAPVRIGAAIRWDLDRLDRWIKEGCPDLRRRGRQGVKR